MAEWRFSSSRAVSPVIGVVLMVALTALLATAVASGVFGQLEDRETTAPTMSPTFYYTETPDAAEVDSFGQTGQTGENGLTTVTIDSAKKSADADQLLLVVDGNEYSWAHHQTPFSVDEEISTGDQVDIWAERGEDILVVWRSESGTEGVVVADYSVSTFSGNGSGGGASHPDPDEDCSWVESELGPPPYSGDLTIDGIIVECDLDQYDIGDLDIINGGGVIGETEADGDIDMSNGSTWEGNVVMLSGGNDLDLDSGSEINGNVNASGNVALDGGSEIGGDINATGKVNAQSSAVIGGGIETDGDVDIDLATIGDKIEGGGDIDVDSGGTVQADVESTNSGSITVTSATILGAVATGEDVDISSNSTVDDHVYEDNGFSCANSEINGQNCGSYTPKDYNEY